MPNYDFICKECQHKFTKMVAIKDKDQVACPVCGGKVRQSFMGSLTGILKGVKDSCNDCRSRSGG